MYFLTVWYMYIVYFDCLHALLPSHVTFLLSGALLYSYLLLTSMFCLFSNLLSLIMVACIYMVVALFTGSCAIYPWLLHWRKLTSFPLQPLTASVKGRPRVPVPSHAAVLMGQSCTGSHNCCACDCHSVLSREALHSTPLHLPAFLCEVSWALGIWLSS